MRISDWSSDVCSSDLDEFAKIWGDLGPVYGKQWRRWVDADGNEHDQIATLVDTLKNNPASRRMLFHAWNVGDLDQMALPHCHMVYKCHVTSQGALNMALFQRSADAFLVLTWNQIAGSVLLLMLEEDRKSDVW